MKNIYKILLSVVLLYGSLSAQAQRRVITGIVKDADGPLPGASILEKDAPSNGVSSSTEGKFQITLRGSGNILTLRAVGYVTKEVNVGGKQSIDIVLEPDTKGLEEVVVVGYGTQKKITVTGSVSSVSRSEIMQTPSASIQNALTGKLPGFFSQQRSGQPGADGADFFVRGVSTFNGNQSPLILVDDIEFSYADFSNIDPNEVESISILKDAATTAVYGVKGANGVVLVTTRRGQAGAPRINFRTEFGLQVPMHVPKFLDAATTATLRNESIKNDGITTGAAYVPEFTDEDIELYRNGQDPYGHPNVDWYNTLFKRTAPSSKTDLDVSGGTERVQYFVSLGYQSQGGVLRNFHTDDDINNNFKFDRYNFRSNLDIKANKSLNLKLDFSGNNTVTNNPVFGGSSSSGPTAAFAEVYSYESLSPYMYNIYNPDGSYGYANPKRVPLGETNNIIGRAALGGYQRERQNLMTLNVSGVQKLDVITKGLQAKALISISNSTSASRTLNRVNFPSFYYDPATGTYTPRNAQIYRIDPYGLSYSAGTPVRQSTIQVNLDYARSFGKSNITGLVLVNQNTKMKAYGKTGTIDYEPENFRGISSRVHYDYDNKYLI